MMRASGRTGIAGTAGRCWSIVERLTTLASAEARSATKLGLSPARSAMFLISATSSVSPVRESLLASSAMGVCSISIRAA